MPAAARKQSLPLLAVAVAAQMQAKGSSGADSGETRKSDKSLPPPVVEAATNDQQVKTGVHVGQGATGRYLVKCLRLSGTPNEGTKRMVQVLAQKRSNQAKEISEIFGCVEALLDFDRKQNLKLRQKRVCAFVPGDGCKPYTSIALLLQTPPSWEVYSIDPMLRTTSCALSPNLRLSPQKLEDFELPDFSDFDAIVILALHSHAPLLSFWSTLHGHAPQLPSACVSIPCCADYGWLSSHELQISYVDNEIMSPQNRVNIYSRNLKCVQCCTSNVK
jgi:hypothetical protein